MQGYQEASIIDKQINRLLQTDPITSENAREWWKFTRTVRTGLEILEERAKEEINKETERIASEKSGNKNGYKVAGPIIKE